MNLFIYTNPFGSISLENLTNTGMKEKEEIPTFYIIDHDKFGVPSVGLLC